MSQRVCVFCGRSLTLGRAREHVFPQWFLEKFGLSQKQYRGTWFSLPGVKVSARQTVFDQMVLGTVCAECNNGWMSELEELTKPIITRFRFPICSEVILQPIESAILATWAVKTAISLNLSSNYRRLFSESDVRCLRDTAFPSKNCFVDVIWTSSPPTISWRQSQWIIGLVPSHPAYRDAMMKSFRITFTAGSTTFRVLVFNSELLRPNPSPSLAAPLWPMSHIGACTRIRISPPIAIDEHDVALNLMGG